MKRSGTFERRRRNAIGSYLPVSCRTDRISSAISVYMCISEWKNAIPSGHTEPQNHLSLTRKQLTRDFQFYKKKLKKKRHLYVPFCPVMNSWLASLFSAQEMCSISPSSQLEQTWSGVMVLFSSRISKPLNSSSSDQRIPMVQTSKCVWLNTSLSTKKLYRHWDPSVHQPIWVNDWMGTCGLKCPVAIQPGPPKWHTSYLIFENRGTTSFCIWGVKVIYYSPPYTCLKNILLCVEGRTAWQAF